MNQDVEAGAEARPQADSCLCPKPLEGRSRGRHVRDRRSYRSRPRRRVLRTGLLSVRARHLDRMARRDQPHGNPSPDRNGCRAPAGGRSRPRTPACRAAVAREVHADRTSGGPGGAVRPAARQAQLPERGDGSGVGEVDRRDEARATPTSGGVAVRGSFDCILSHDSFRQQATSGAACQNQCTDDRSRSGQRHILP